MGSRPPYLFAQQAYPQWTQAFESLTLRQFFDILTLWDSGHPDKGGTGVPYARVGESV